MAKRNTEEESFELINLTPHALTVFPLGKGDPFELAATGKQARVTAKSVPIGGIFTVVEYGEVTGLPEPKAGFIYIVSGLVRSAVPLRMDVASPGELVRDDAGKPIGCKGLVLNPELD